MISMLTFHFGINIGDLCLYHTCNDKTNTCIVSERISMTITKSKIASNIIRLYQRVALSTLANMSNIGEMCSERNLHNTTSNIVSFNPPMPPSLSFTTLPNYLPFYREHVPIIDQSHKDTVKNTFLKEACY